MEKKATFIKLMTEELKGKGLTLFEKAVYSSLYGKYQYYSESFYTYEKYIAEELEISEKTVMRAITKLKELNLISVEKKYNKETKKVVNYYTINEPSVTSIKDNNEEAVQKDKKDATELMSMDTIKVAQKGENEAKQADEQELTPREKKVVEYFKEYVDDMHKTLRLPSVEDLKIKNETSFSNPNFNKIAFAIEENFNTKPEIYFSNINKLYDIQYSTLEELARLSNTNPQITLDFIKEIRHIETTY